MATNVHLALELTALSKMRPLSPIFDDEVITHKLARNYWVSYYIFGDSKKTKASTVKLRVSTCYSHKPSQGWTYRQKSTAQNGHQRGKLMSM